VYFCLMRSASALRFSNVCSSLNLERMLRRVLGEGRAVKRDDRSINQSPRVGTHLFTGHSLLPNFKKA
jgi:hypothetical protein